MGTRGHSCDHRLMKGRRGREVDCLAAAGYRLAYGGVAGGGDPFERGYIQWQAEQLVKQKRKAGRAFHPSRIQSAGVEEETEREE